MTLESTFGSMRRSDGMIGGARAALASSFFNRELNISDDDSTRKDKAV